MERNFSFPYTTPSLSMIYEQTLHNWQREREEERESTFEFQSYLHRILSIAQCSVDASHMAKIFAFFLPNHECKFRFENIFMLISGNNYAQIGSLGICPKKEFLKSQNYQYLGAPLQSNRDLALLKIFSQFIYFAEYFKISPLEGDNAPKRGKRARKMCDFMSLT
jgi:hypothetical protein